MDKNTTSGFWGLLGAVIDNRRTKKAVKRVQQQNIANQGLVRYRPSQIEAFFDANDPVCNMIFSGGADELRIRSIIRALECAFMQGASVLVLHCGNSLLEQNAYGYFGQHVVLINRNNPIYDPFVDLTNNNIVDIILASSTKKHLINSAGRYYITGICSYIRSLNKSPHCYSFINCPHLELINQVNDAESQGRITSAEAKSIISQLLQGDVEKANIESFFNELSIHGGNILSDKSNVGYSINLTKAAQYGKILLVDVQSSINTLLINLLANEAILAQEKGMGVLIVADGLQFDSSDALTDYIRRTGSHSSFIASSDDVFSTFGSDEKAFNTLAGKSSKLIISKHSSAFSSQKFSEVIGSFEKQEMTESKTRHIDFFKQWGLGSTNTLSLSTKREYIVKPEEIQRLAMDEVYILDKHRGELAFTRVI